MPAPKERQDIKVQLERAILAAVHLPDYVFDERDPLGELRALAESAGATVVGELVQRRHKPEAGTFMGTGKLVELKEMCEALDAAVVIFDNQLSPKQIGGIERVVERKVVDRCELILDIFATRATTHQAKLAVELAQLEYTYPRLRAMWTHLERIVGAGGIGGVGTRGPGEQQLEIDRRIVQRKRVVLRRELDEIHSRKAREVAARKHEHFTVGLVGYTNAGKSTLFNTLTAGGAYADDRLFTTLMSRTREWRLGGAHSVMLSDTVGFIRDLPHNLVESFRATLEEATRADVLLVVLDVSDPAAELQLQTVRDTLEDLFVDVRERGAGPDWSPPEQILLLNKADRLRDNSSLLVWQQQEPEAIPLCALDENGLGQDTLRERILTRLTGAVREFEVTMPLRDSRRIDLVEKSGEVLSRDYEGQNVRLRVRMGARIADTLRRGGATVTSSELPMLPAEGSG